MVTGVRTPKHLGSGDGSGYRDPRVRIGQFYTPPTDLGDMERFVNSCFIRNSDGTLKIPETNSWREKQLVGVPKEVSYGGRTFRKTIEVDADGLMRLRYTRK